MNCIQAREKLAALIYGDLAPAENAAVESHLTQCADCCREQGALQEVNRLLNTVPVPNVSVDLGRLFQEAALRQERRLRHWRRATLLIATAAAVAAVFVLGRRCELRWEHHQLVVRWGEPPAPLRPEAPRVEPSTAPIKQAVLSPEAAGEERLHLLSELIRALADDVRALERRQRTDASALQVRLDGFEQENVRRYASIERAVDALYLLCHKGE